jgi:hypothetical protein
MKNLLLLLISLPAFASNVTISYTQGNSLILKSSSCETLLNEYQKVCEFRQSIEPNFQIPNIERNECKRNSDGSQRVIISNCLTPFMKENQNQRLKKDGANCWGTAMSLKKISSKPRFVWSKEMIYWQESPICRKVEVGEEKRPGDILNIYGPEYIFERDEYAKGDAFFDTLYPNRKLDSPVTSGYSGFYNFLHSETYVSENISFGKESPNKLDRFQFNPLGEVYGRSRDSECQENQSIVPSLRENDNERQNLRETRCKGYVSIAYRCQNFTTFFEDNISNSYQREIYEEALELQNIQSELFALMKGKTISSARVNEIVKMADKASSEALMALESQPEKIEEMVLSLKFFTAHGLRKSLEQALLIEATELL